MELNYKERQYLLLYFLNPPKEIKEIYRRRLPEYADDNYKFWSDVGELAKVMANNEKEAWEEREDGEDWHDRVWDRSYFDLFKEILSPNNSEGWYEGFLWRHAVENRIPYNEVRDEVFLPASYDWRWLEGKLDSAIEGAESTPKPEEEKGEKENARRRYERPQRRPAGRRPAKRK